MKKLILGLLFAGLGWSQNTGQNVVSLNLNCPSSTNPVTCSATSRTLAIGTTNIISAVLQNIGQTSHIVQTSIGSIAAGGSATLVKVIQGSPDCATWFNIGPVTNFSISSTLQSGNTITTVGYGAFPCLRVYGTITVAGNTIQLNTSYSGTSAPVFNNIDQFSPNIGLSSYVAAMVYIPTKIAAPPVILNEAALVALYGYSIFAPSTVTGLIIYCSDTTGSPNSANLVAISNVTNLAAISTPSIRAIGSCAPNEYLWYSATGSGTATINVQYRIE